MVTNLWAYGCEYNVCERSSNSTYSHPQMGPNQLREVKRLCLVLHITLATWHIEN